MEMSDLSMKLIQLQNQKQIIDAEYKELCDEITAKCNSQDQMLKKQQRVAKDIIVIEIQLQFGDLENSLQLFSLSELRVIWKALNKIEKKSTDTLQEINKFKSVVLLIDMLRKQEGTWKLTELKKIAETVVIPSANGYTATFRTYNSYSYLTYHL